MSDARFRRAVRDLGSQKLNSEDPAVVAQWVAWSTRHGRDPRIDPRPGDRVVLTTDHLYDPVIRVLEVKRWKNGAVRVRYQRNIPKGKPFRIPTCIQPTVGVTDWRRMFKDIDANGVRCKNPWKRGDPSPDNPMPERAKAGNCPTCWKVRGHSGECWAHE